MMNITQLKHIISNTQSSNIMGSLIIDEQDKSEQLALVNKFSSLFVDCEMNTPYPSDAQWQVMNAPLSDEQLDEALDVAKKVFAMAYRYKTAFTV